MKNFNKNHIIIFLLLLSVFTISLQGHTYQSQQADFEAEAKVTAERNADLEVKAEKAAMVKEMEEMKTHIAKQNELIEEQKED